MSIRIAKSYETRNDGRKAKVLEWDETYIGRVLHVREKNGYDDSDFFALCWDDDKAKMVEIMYATTRGYTYDNSAIVDYTPESDDWHLMIDVLKPRAQQAIENQCRARHNIMVVGDWVKTKNGTKSGLVFCEFNEQLGISESGIPDDNDMYTDVHFIDVSELEHLETPKLSDAERFAVANIEDDEIYKWAFANAMDAGEYFNFKLHGLI